MPEFSYRGRNSEGDLISGKCESTTADALATQLSMSGITPIHIEPLKNQKDMFGFMRRFQLTPEKIKVEQLLIFCRQMHALIKAGVPVVGAITGLSEITLNQRFAEALSNVANNISAGQNLATALQQYPAIFPSLFVKLIQVGETTGNLEEAFLQMSEYFELEDITFKRINTILRYPLIVLITIVAAMVIINMFVIPAFAKLYAGFHTALPLPTRILINASLFFQQYWYWILGIVFICGYWLKCYLKTTVGRFAWDKLQLKLPIFGEVIERILLARFARTFSIILRSGIPLTQGIELVAEATTNTYARQRITQMQQYVERGESITSAAVNIKLFSPLMLQMLAVGEQTGALDRMLLEVTKFYEREVDYDLKQLADRVEPVLIVCMGGMVLILALGVFLPMWNMTNFAGVKS